MNFHLFLVIHAKLLCQLRTGRSGTEEFQQKGTFVFEDSSSCLMHKLNNQHMSYLHATVDSKYELRNDFKYSIKMKAYWTLLHILFSAGAWKNRSDNYWYIHQYFLTCDAAVISFWYSNSMVSLVIWKGSRCDPTEVPFFPDYLFNPTSLKPQIFLFVSCNKCLKTKLWFETSIIWPGRVIRA